MLDVLPILVATVLPLHTIQAPDGALTDQFGASVAVAGDRLLVGAPGRQAGAFGDAGAVYVFSLPDLTFERRIDAPSPSASSDFGRRICAVGSNQFAAGGGTAWLCNTALPISPRQLTPPPPLEGFPVAFVSNGAEIAISEIFADNEPGVPGGSVHVFDGQSGTFLRTLVNPGTNPNNSSFANSLWVDGGTLYAGSIYNKPEEPTAGSGQVVSMDLMTGALIDEYSDPTMGQNLFGAAVLKYGNRLVVSPGYDDGFPYGYLYIYEDGSTTHTITLRSPALENHIGNDNYGAALATWKGDLLISAPRGPGDGDVRGLIYWYAGESLQEIGQLRQPPEAEPWNFGRAIAIWNDWLITSAFDLQFNATELGEVYVYDLQANKPKEGWMVLSPES